MALLAQLIVNGIIAGSLYALVAAGFSLIYATNSFMHFAHGISVVVSAYILLTLFTILHVPFFLACLLTLVLAALFGLFMNRAIYVPMRKRRASNVVLLIASIGLLILFQNVVQLLFGAQVRTIGYVGISRGMDVLGAIVTPIQIWIVAITALLLPALWLLMRRTRLGRDMRAVADNRELASIVGINPQRIADYSFLIGSALAGLAGILIGLEQNLVPPMGTSLMIKGFTGAVIGGITSVPGAIVGSYVLGLVENLGIWYLPSGYKDAIAFALLFLFLLLRPTGLFGISKGVKE